jgi:hypothetical protein
MIAAAHVPTPACTDSCVRVHDVAGLLRRGRSESEGVVYRLVRFPLPIRYMY